MRDENCIFCKIIAGEIPSNTIYEDDEFKVVLDVSPASKGHALILPKNHYADLYEIDENVAADAMKLAKKLAIHMTDVLKCDGFNLVQNNHEVAGQTVFHFHMHLIPRYLNAKNNDILNWSHETFSPEEMAEGYVTGIALDENNEVIGYQFVSLGKMTDFIKKGDDPNTAWEKAKGQYGRVADAVKIIDPRKE